MRRAPILPLLLFACLQSGGSSGISTPTGMLLTGTLFEVTIAPGTIFSDIQGDLGGGTPGVSVQNLVPRAGILTQLRLCTTGTQPADGSFTFTANVNGSNTALVAIVAANAPAGCFLDSTHKIAVASGALLSFELKNNASGNTGGVVNMSVFLQ